MDNQQTKPQDNVPQSVKSKQAQEIYAISKFMWAWHIERGLQGCGTGMEFNDIFHAINDYAAPLKSRISELEQQNVTLREGGQKLFGFIENIMNHTGDQMSDFYIEWADKVMHETDELFVDEQALNRKEVPDE